VKSLFTNRERFCAHHGFPFLKQIRARLIGKLPPYEKPSSGSRTPRIELPMWKQKD
jgi:hypothetical protein